MYVYKSMCMYVHVYIIEYIEYNRNKGTHRLVIKKRNIPHRAHILRSCERPRLTEAWRQMTGGYRPPIYLYAWQLGRGGR